MATASTVSAFESTLQKTHTWLKDLNDELSWPESDHQRAYHALRAVLHALRDRLSAEESSDFAAQLPMLIRGFYYEGWNPARTPIPARSRTEFLEHVAQNLQYELYHDEEEVTRAVFRVVGYHVTLGEIDDVKHALPRSIRELWS